MKKAKDNNGSPDAPADALQIGHRVGFPKENREREPARGKKKFCLLLELLARWAFMFCLLMRWHDFLPVRETVDRERQLAAYQERGLKPTGRCEDSLAWRQVSFRIHQRCKTRSCLVYYGQLVS